MSRLSRNEPVGVPTRQPPIPLQAPGIEAPRFYANNDDAIALLDVLRGAGSLGATVAAAARQDFIINEEAKDELRGLGVRKGRNRQATLVKEILDGKRPVPEGVTFEDYAAVIVEQDAGGFDPVSVQGFKDAVVPALVEAFNRRQKFTQDLADDETFQLDAEALATIPDSKEARAIITRNAAKFQDHTETERLSKLIVPAMKRAAADGNVERVAFLKQVLGARLPLDQAAADATLKDAQTQNTIREGAEFRRQMDARFNAVEGGRDTFQNVREHLRGLEKSTDPTLFRSAMDELNERERSAARALAESEFDSAVAAGRVQWEARNDALVSSGLGFSIDDVTIKAGDREKTLTNGLDEAMERAFAAIAATNATPEEKLAQTADLSSRNGYIPPLWKRTLQAGFVAGTEQALEPGGKDEAPPPRATIAGFDLYKSLRAIAPGILEGAITSEATRDFYETAAVLQEDPSIGDNNTKALFEARRILSGPGRFNDTDRAAIADAAHDIGDRFWSADAKNWPEVAAQIARRAEVYARTGLDPEQAVKRAAETVARGRVNINGWSQPTADANLPEALRADFPALAQSILEDWATRNGEGTGLDADDVTIRAGLATGFWAIADGRTGFYVGGEQAVFSTADMIRLWQETRDSDRLNKIKATLIEQNRNVDLRNQPFQDPFGGLEVGGP